MLVSSVVGEGGMITVVFVFVVVFVVLVGS